ncbi:tubulin polyglutamylase TTLL11 isoform X1 [Rhineura floridana]|uniref:tubulin polyglutamylase TTLL11 isoform X1 n=1 Tax=Rhineura floridana TaxID=261503 RepID=UPI002AC804AE|nr:tubulin polyglutamylase TTLL11 isoform X1 [Rhineura floridana]
METPPGADVAARLLEAAGGEQEAAAEEEAARRAGHQPEEEAARRAGHQPEPAEDAAAAAPSGGPCPAAAAPSARARRGCSAKAAPAAARASRRKKGSTAAPGPRPRPRRAPRPVTVDSSKARTSLEALKLSLRQLRWKEFPFGRRLPCDIYWHAVSFHDNAIYSGQVNKFPGMTEMVRKITLSRAMRTMQELFPEEYNFYPRSWILPEELAIFFAEVHMIRDTRPSWRPTFIVKPDGGCQGDGIYLIKDPGDIRMTGTLQTRPAVVQEYMSKPLLIDKLKFDIRLYVLLKSLDPLEIYIAKDGLCRFCTEPYQEPTLKNLHRVFMHLTNYSLNVHSGNFVHSDSVNTGSKQTFSSILDRLSAKGVDVRKVWSDIISLVIKTVIAMVPDLKVYYQSDIPTGKPGPSCFQILGFDILLMKNLKPILLEVNANPSMKIEHEKEVSPGVIEYIPSPVDEEVKVAVIRDTLRLVDPHKKKKEEKLAEPPQPELQEKDDLLEEGSVENPQLDGSKDPEAAVPSICLKQVFPKYAKQFDYLRLVDRIATLFIRFLGVKGTMKLGATAFRMFIRNSKISNSGFSMAAADILYIDITRRGSGSLSMDQRDTGMGLQAFVEAVCFLAQRRYKSLSLHEQVELLVDFCEFNLAAWDERRLSCSRAVPERRMALVTCQQDGLHLSPATPTPPQFHSTTAHKLVNYRSPRP